MVVAQNVRPANASSPMTKLGNRWYELKEQPNHKAMFLIPLSSKLRKMQDDSKFKITGTIAHVHPDNANKLNDTDIPLVSCDDSAYSGRFTPNDTISTLLSHEPLIPALILFSSESKRCEYDDPPNSVKAFSLKGPLSAKDLEDITGRKSTSTILLESDKANAPTNSDTENQEFNTQPYNDPGSGGKSPSTSSTAMIILYSVTGIITALFLVVILSGAIRAHLHPERYGPRNVPGRPRQSRAKGIARAMLETLPIVKFGDQDDPKPPSKDDIEMCSNDGDEEGRNTEKPQDKAPNAAVVPAKEKEKGSTEQVKGGVRQSSDDSGIGPARPETPATQEPAAPATQGCTICAEDFVKGQDVRLLPCNHKFHPECIDPWLVDVSGTCPLCRVDLRTPEEDTNQPNGEGATSTTLPPPLSDEAGPRQNTNVVPNDNTIQERLDTIRRLRSEQQNQSTPGAGAIGPSEEGNDRRSRRLSARVRDKFRIRTRRHEGGGPPPPPAS